MRSVEALQRAYYDYPTTAEADRAGAELDRQDVDLDAAFAPKELARAETLFQARRWTHAQELRTIRRKPFVDRRRSRARGDAASRRPRWRSGGIAKAATRCGRCSTGRSPTRRISITSLRRAGLKLRDEHAQLARAFVDKFPASPFADEVLNNLASAYIVDDQDDEAEAVFREIVERYPAGRFAERAAWKAGWWAYRQGRFAEARAAISTRRRAVSALRLPAVVALLGGRAAQQAGDVETGVARLRLAATDYHNSYYGRLAVARLQGSAAARSRPRCGASRRRPPAIPTRRPHRGVAGRRASTARR